MEGTKYMEDTKMAATVDAEAELSDEAEEEAKSFEKSHFELTWTNIENVKCAEGAPVVVLDAGVPQALIRILFDDKLTELATAQVKKINKDAKKEDEPKTILKVQSAGNLTILSPQESLSSKHCGQIVATLLKQLTKPTIICMQSVYKTNYSTKEGHLMISDDQDPSKLPIRYVKSSHANPIVDKFIAQKHAQVSVDTQYNFTGGLSAGLLMEAEMQGLGAIAVKQVVDQHCVTLESLQSMAPILKDLLAMADADKALDNLTSSKSFRPVLKELNAKTNGIYQ